MARPAAEPERIDATGRVDDHEQHHAADHCARVVLHDVEQGSGNAGDLRFSESEGLHLWWFDLCDFDGSKGTAIVGHFVESGEEAGGSRRAGNLSAVAGERCDGELLSNA